MQGMRNFWITGDAEGRKTNITFGGNQFGLKVAMLEDGQSIIALRITGTVMKDGTLRLEAEGNGQHIEIRTTRGIVRRK